MKKTFNKQLMTAAVAALVLSASATTTFAAPDSEKDLRAQQDAKFRKFDANGDGGLSREELRSIPHYGKSFAQADEDKDGRLSQGEFMKAEAIHDREQAAAFLDDSVITAKVKGSLLKEMKSLQVSVETHRGNVLLSGFVDNESQIKKAIQVASSVQGVHSVKNGLAIK